MKRKRRNKKGRKTPGKPTDKKVRQAEEPQDVQMLGQVDDSEPETVHNQNQDQMTDENGQKTDEEQHNSQREKRRKVAAQTQTCDWGGTDAQTQTPLIKTSDSQTQTNFQQEIQELEPERDTEKPRGESEVQGSSINPMTKGQRSYSEAAAGNRASGGSRKVSPVRPPETITIFTFHIYAVLDKKFKFSRDRDCLILFLHQQQKQMELKTTHFMGNNKKGNLIEATLSVEERLLTQGMCISYQYGVKQKQKISTEIASRFLQIPWDPTVKEIHLFEGHISWPGSSTLEWLFGLGRSRDHSSAWEDSAHILLDSIFQKWSPYDQNSTQTFVELLKFYQWSFNFNIHRRIIYPKNVCSPDLKVSEWIADQLVNILPVEDNSKVADGSLVDNPLVVGLAVFWVCRGCCLDLGLKHWARLCHVVSSGAALSPTSITATQQIIPALSQCVIGLMNHCASRVVVEVVLLVPLLLTLRRPEAEESGSPGEEDTWAGLEGFCYHRFREHLSNLSDKRSMMMQLIKSPQAVILRSPRVLTAWLTLVAFEDVGKLVIHTGIPPEHVIQSLVFRLKVLEQTPNRNRTERDLRTTETVLSLILQRVEEEKERICCSQKLDSILQCCVCLQQSICHLTQLVLQYRTVILSFQLLLSMAELMEKEGGSETLLLETLVKSQDEVQSWRQNLLQNPLMKSSRLTYSKEIELWDALFRVSCSVEDFSRGWIERLQRDLRRRISQMSVEDQVIICCLDPTAEALDRSHTSMQTCFQQQSQSAIQDICKSEREGALLTHLFSLPVSLPPAVLSFIVLESSSRFGDDPVECLLAPQSAVYQLLSRESHLDGWCLQDGARQVILESERIFLELVTALSKGNVRLDHLKTTLMYRGHFLELYRRYQRTCPDLEDVDPEKLLLRRENDHQALLQQKEHMDALIKMMGKVSELITAPEMTSLERKHRTDLEPLSLSQLLAVQDCSVMGLETPVASVVWYRASPVILQMAQEMHAVHKSTLLLSYWEEAAMVASRSQGTMPISVSLEEVSHRVWKPCLSRFHQLGVRIAGAAVTFMELNDVLKRTGEQGSGVQMRNELLLMETQLSGDGGLASGWAELRLGQIQQYRQLRHTSHAAKVILQIRDWLELRGDFHQIQHLACLSEESFQHQSLSSLSDVFVSAELPLIQVTAQQKACLEEFVNSHTLVSWVQKHLTNVQELKVFVDLASISAGENDTEIDRVCNFDDAVKGYSPLIYNLKAEAGLKDFLLCAQQVWDALNRDEKLQDKLRDSTYILGWLKALRETHGSVEQSSLSLASDINAHGLYLVGKFQEHAGKYCLQNLLLLRVEKDKQIKEYRLEELLELQNKLMLMSSKGDHGKEQVNRFMQMFEGVQTAASILLKLQTTGNVLFRDWEARVYCSQEKDPCIHVRFSLMQEEIVYRGQVSKCLQELSRSLDMCYKDWCTFMSEMRSEFQALNHYTSEQLVHLSRLIYCSCAKQTSVPQETWHLLASVKPGCTLNEMREAFVKVTELSDDNPAHKENRGHTDDSDMENGDGEKRVPPETEALMQEDSVDDVGDVWKCFKEDMPRFLTDQLDIGSLGQFLTELSSMYQQHIKRKLPSVLLEGRPNLILCSETEVLRTALSVYMESPEQALPSSDEVLMCHGDTTEEQVELFLRRCLGQRAAGVQQKIYTLLNPDLLAYDVSVALGEHFDVLDRSAGLHYRLVVVCSVQHQSRYVPTFFSHHRVHADLCAPSDKVRNFIFQHFTVPTNLDHLSSVYPNGLSVWVVSSQRPGVGKSLYVRRLFEKFQKEISRAQYLTIRFIEPHVDLDSFVTTLRGKLKAVREQDPVMVNIDAGAVRSGLEDFLFHFLILGCLTDSRGNLWRRNARHLITVEVLEPPSKVKSKETGQLLEILPTIFCRSPREVKELQPRIKIHHAQKMLDPLMDDQEFESEWIQRPYQYLKHFNRSNRLDNFKYIMGSAEGNPMDCLHHLLENCGLQDPTWAELKNFTWFLNLQLRDCENSAFCDPDFLGNNLPGFKAFIVKFMIRMSCDFASPSMDISDQSPTLTAESNNDDELLARLTIRKRWESESHPYIFFNADHISMSFMGFHVKKQPVSNILNAVDPVSQKVLVKDVMSAELLEGLMRQRISLTENFDNLPREDKIQRISFVVGATRGYEKGRFDPDPTYELTADNVMKMLAIHMRFRCAIPVIIMGETGCGKTRLVRFLCDLQREGRDVENMKLVKVHGGTTAETIYSKVWEAERQAILNQQMYKIDTILFFDEANTTEAIFAIKEVLCDKTAQGVPLKPNSGLKIIAACNPYRRHSPEMIERLECAGLGYRVRAGETEDRLGKVPLRQLVYRVHPLPPSMIPLVWDFGQLSKAAECAYITQIVERQMKDNHLPVECLDDVSNVLAASQQYMRHCLDECSFVSLRDVERSMKVLVWFFHHRDQLMLQHKAHSICLVTMKCLALAVGVCYYPSLHSREEYLESICKHFPQPLSSAEALGHEISECQGLFLEKIQPRDTIAKNLALKENVFLMVVCIELKIPLFLVGKTGSSKSLAKTVVADAMQGQNSQCNFFRELKEVHMVSFQCSPHSSPEGIIGTFRNCARYQKEKDMEKYVSVVVLDEIGLAEDSPQMPLKTLHPLLEDGCIDTDKPDPHMKVGFVGISNWALDPAKMNRGIFVSRWDPTENELVKTAEGICSSSKPIFLKIKHLLPALAKGFLKICEVARNQFFGLRDFYSLVKMVFAMANDSGQEPRSSELAEAIARNFSGLPEDFDPLCYFNDILQDFKDITKPSTLTMVKHNLGCHNNECRYLLLLTSNNAALHILQQHVFTTGSRSAPEIVFGSGFPKDQEYSQICRNVNRVKICMETGRTVILLNLQNLYESLYDALNQYYVFLSGQQYVDLGLGSHRVKCRVHKNFRLVVVEDQEKVYKQFPVPLINRLEKHRVNRSTDLTPWQSKVLEKIKEWVEEFSLSCPDFKPSDVFIGFHWDACASALLQALEKRKHQRAKKGTDVSLDMQEERKEENALIISQHAHNPGEIEETGATCREIQDCYDMEVEKDEIEGRMSSENGEEEIIFELAKGFLLNCATPDSVLRLKYADMGHQERNKLHKMYFHQQHHHSLRDFIDGNLSQSGGHCRFIEVTTFSSLLTKLDVDAIAQKLGLMTKCILLLSLHQFDTEASFCCKIRRFLQNGGLSQHMILIQMDMEESRCSEELMASAKYSAMNELVMHGLEESSSHVVLITKLSRMTQGPQYIGFQGGLWHSVHIDDIRDTELMSLDLSALCGLPVSEVILQSAAAEGMEECSTSVPEKKLGGAPHLDVLSLMRSCIQKAVSLLKDTMASRSMERVRILLALMKEDLGISGAKFQRVLVRRLTSVLVQKEECMHSPEEWLHKEARKRQALQEGGTLRHTLWHCLQSTLTPVLAQMLEVLDRDDNLDLLYSAGLSEGLTGLWCDILGDEQILDLTLASHSSGVEQEINVQCHLVVGGLQRSCVAPFSWLIKNYCQSLLEEFEFLSDTQQDSIRFVSSVCSSRLGSHLGKLSRTDHQDFGKRYLSDFILLCFEVQSEVEEEVLTKALLGCISAICQSTFPADVSPAWILAARHYYAPRLDTLSHILHLQPHLAARIVQNDSSRETAEMTEDIVALGMCVEETRLQLVTSLPECRSFLGRVQLLQPCVERAFGEIYKTMCSSGCVQQLDAIKRAWHGILVLAAFIEQVVTEDSMSDAQLAAVTLAHCHMLHGVMERSPDLLSPDGLQQIIRILNSFHMASICRDLRFGRMCPVCLLDVTDPSVLPCGHIFCLMCLQQSIQEDRPKFCPKCRTDLPPGFQPEVSLTAMRALQRDTQVRRCCNSFFLEVVSRFCLREGQSPSDGLVELLFSLLISAQGDVYKTRDLTPFLECVDQSPVVRSVLPKLLLQHSFQQVKGHIQTYLQQLQQHLLLAEDHGKLYLFFVSCFQDSLQSAVGRGHLQEDTAFLSRLARRQLPARQQDPAEFLLWTARLRVCLETAAALLLRVLDQENGEPKEAELQFLDQVKAVCEYSGNEWYRVYLLRAVNRLTGVQSVEVLMNCARWGWVVPPEVARRQALVPAELDRFLSFGPPYLRVREAVGQLLLEDKVDALRLALQENARSSSPAVLFILALFRQVTCQLELPVPKFCPQRLMKALEEILPSCLSGDLVDFAAGLLSNRIGGRMSTLQLDSGQGARRRALLELLVHAAAVLYSGNRLLSDLRHVASPTQDLARFFLPTMTDDHSSEAHHWLNEPRPPKKYQCPNGHVVFVGECTRPVETSRCLDCGAEIGGRNHNPVEGFTAVGGGMWDQTRTGHILGAARCRTEAPNRGASMTQSCILRLLTHLAMMLGATQDQQAIQGTIHPHVQDPIQFLWQHLEVDMEQLGQILDLNVDNTVVTVHLILSECSSGAHQQVAHLDSRAGRESWERGVCVAAIDPVVQDLKRKLSQAQDWISADETPLMKLLFSDPTPLLPRLPDCPTHYSAFWKIPDRLSLQRLSQVIDQKGNSTLPLLAEFLRKVPCIRQLCHLPDLAALQIDLFRAFPTESAASSHSIAAMFQKLSSGHLRKTLLRRVKIFMEVWNKLRMEVSSDARMGVPLQLCETELTMESSSQFLSPSRHGPGSCLEVVINFLSQTQNDLIREARKLKPQEDRDYSVAVETLSEIQLVLIDPERELVPLVLTHCHYTLVKGHVTDASYDMQNLQNDLYRRFLAGKPLIQADTSKFLNRHLQDFSVILAEVRSKIAQEPLKGLVHDSMKSILRSFSDVCDAVTAVEVALRFLGKTGGEGSSLLLSYLKDSLRMGHQISASVAKALAECRLSHCTPTWQLLTCWKSELMLKTGQDPFPGLAQTYRTHLSPEEKRAVKVFLGLTDINSFTLELHEILLLKTGAENPDAYQPQWDISSTLENHLLQKGTAAALPGLHALAEDITLHKAAEIWKMAVELH